MSYLIVIGVMVLLLFIALRENKKEIDYKAKANLAKELLDREYCMKKARIMFKLSDNRGNRRTEQYSHYTYDRNSLMFNPSWTPEIKVVSAKEVATKRIEGCKNFITDDQGAVYPVCNVLEMWVVRYRDWET